MTRGGAAGAVVAVILAAGAAGAQAASAPAAASTHPAPTCPTGPPAKVAHNPWRSANRRLAPTGALTVRLCRYSSLNRSRPTALVRSRLIRDRHLVGALIEDFDQLPPAPRGPVSCPADDGSRILALLAYPGGREVTILVELTGCRYVRNGDMISTAAEPHSGSNLIDELERLTPPRHS